MWGDHVQFRLTSTGGVACVSSRAKLSGMWLDEMVTRLFSDWWLWWLCRLLMCALCWPGEFPGEPPWWCARIGRVPLTVGTRVISPLWICRDGFLGCCWNVDSATLQL